MGLLALTFVSALAVTWVLQNRESRKLSAQLSAVSAELNLHEAALTYQADPRQMLALCQDAVQGAESPSRLFLELESKFQSLRSKYSRLEITDPSLIAMRSIPVLTPRDQSRFDCRVYIPARQNVELEILATQPSSRRKRNSGKDQFLENSDYDFDGKFVHQMAEGQSLIEFAWDKSATPATVTVKVNGKSIFSTTHSGREFSGGGWSSISSSQYELKKREYARLIQFQPTTKPESDEIMLVLRRKAPTSSDEKAND